MIDVHPPHEATHSWKDFFIHIATIVVGLLIAIGLEQSVEFFHHRHLAEQSRELLSHELDANIAAVQENLRFMDLRVQQHRADLAVVHHARAHTLGPAENLAFVHAHRVFNTAAWTTIHESGASSYLPYDLLTRYAALYSRQADITTVYGEANVAVQNATAVLNGEAEDPSRAAEDGGVTTASAEQRALSFTGGHDALLQLTPAQFDRLELGYQQAIEDDRRLKRLYLGLAHFYQIFQR